jgi:2-hydroxy-3-keto-5-methylthiopentenyl-1-phosphate phosphatase
MKTRDRKYRALLSSDWNECLSPAGSFDVVSFVYPSLEPRVKEIFKAYTGNRIPFSEATRRMAALLPQTITADQMDSYLDGHFATYPGVSELIEWCRKKDILFMVNTTGMQGYFQRAFEKRLLPDVPVISANPVIKYAGQAKAPVQWYDILEIQDKPKNTQTVMRALGIPPDQVVLIGDSGGDGPHFEWGARLGAFLVGSMTKWSLDKYCSERGIEIDLYFGPRYSEGEKRKEGEEAHVHFLDLVPAIEAFLARGEPNDDPPRRGDQS